MSEWVYRVGLSQKEITEVALQRSGLKYELVEVETALRSHIPETLDKPYKFHTAMREDAPNAFSCSSLISYLYVFAGIGMPSLVIDKFFFVKPVTKEELRFGDVIFSSSEVNDEKYPARTTSVEYMPGKLTSEKPVTHIGMYVGGGEVLHAAGTSYKGKVIQESLEESPSFKDIVGYGRLAENLKEKRYIVSVPDDKPELRKKENLIQYLLTF